jgi:uncharacterized protein
MRNVNVCRLDRAPAAGVEANSTTAVTTAAAATTAASAASCCSHRAPRQPRKYQPSAERLQRADVEVRTSNIHRYGVFAGGLILPGEVIEECPVVVLPEYVPALCNLYFKDSAGRSLFVLGYGSFYNHADKPNALFEMDHDRGLMVFVATKPIYRNEEIFVDYGNTWFKERDMDMVTPEMAVASSRKQGKHRISRLIFAIITLALISYGIITGASNVPRIAAGSLEATEGTAVATVPEAATPTAAATTAPTAAGSAIAPAPAAADAPAVQAQ